MNQLFQILHLRTEDVERLAAQPNKPHQHDYEELIIGVAGQLEHFIDFKTTVLEAPFASFVTKGKTHRVQPGALGGACNMWVLRFKSEFIPETTFQLYANYHDHANISLAAGACFRRQVVLCELIDGEMQQPVPDLGIVRHLLSALFTMIESERRKQVPEEQLRQSTQNTTFKNFLAILEDYFRRPEGVEFYAEKLFMSARNLNLICQHILQKSVSEIIETRKLIEAKNLLATTDLPVSEIGFELGYNEKAYFTNVFKKKSGQTPTEFREEMRRLVNR
ncbi:MAG: helix-turn-helix transcriptional regulator [Saprospiraceae bacterium]|nr:helix-turn-helix transcriptional regulator [Saprospiraceae bacterium]